MNRVSTLPYATPVEGRIAISPGSWRVTRGGETENLPDYLSGWDPTVDLQVSCELEADVESLYSDCQLSHDARVAFSLAWTSTGTTLKGCGPVVPVSDDRLVLSADISGNLLGGTLHVNARAVLVEPGADQGPLAPNRPWSILWSERRSIQLEGSAGRFPVEWTDFTSSRAFHPDAGWCLDWDRDLERPVLGSVRLYLNQSHETVRAAVEAPHPDEAQRVILETIRYDIARVLITGALEDERFADESNEYEPETLGSTLRSLVATFYSDVSLEHLRGRTLDFRSDFESGLQGRLRYLFSDPSS